MAATNSVSRKKAQEPQKEAIAQVISSLFRRQPKGRLELKSDGGILTGRWEGIRDVVTCLWIYWIVFDCVSLGLCSGCPAGRGLFYGLTLGVKGMTMRKIVSRLNRLNGGAVLAGPYVAYAGLDSSKSRRLHHPVLLAHTRETNRRPEI